MDEKSELRRVLAQRRAEAFTRLPDAGAALARRFPASISIDQHVVVGGYMPFRTEIDPLVVLRALGARGAQTAMPRISSAMLGLPLPPVGRGSGGGGTVPQAYTLQKNACPTTPHPNPSPQGGGALHAKDRAKRLRKEPTKYEQKLWDLLRAKRPGKTHWRRQVVIGGYVYDFGCHGLRLLVEVDGGVHKLPEVELRDGLKTQVAQEHGYQLVRLQNEDVLKIETAQYFDQYARSNSPSPSWGGVGVGGTSDSASIEPEALTFHLCDFHNDTHFRTNTWGILEPRADLPVVTPNIVLVPLLGFDRQGNRLGYGKGFYDRAIQHLKPNVTTIGLAFAEQEVDTIPTQLHDQRLDWIITPNEAYRTPS